MKFLLNSLFLLLFALTSAQNYDKFFTNEVLRIDFYLFGGEKQTKASIQSLKKEPFFAGTREKRIFPDYGTFRYELRDAKTQQPLYRKGFAPLYSEWLHTEEAKTNKWRIFEQVAHLPFPKNEVIFEVARRTFENQWEVILSESISPKSYFIQNETPFPYPITRLYGNRPPHKAVDLVIIPDGYTAQEMEKFIQDSKKMIDYLLHFPPYSKYKDAFNVYAVQVPSQESGTDIPKENLFRKTALHSHFSTFDSDRYLTTPSLFALADYTAPLPTDQVFVLVNTENYGGGGFYNVMNIGASDAPYNKEVFIHEFGHGFVGLGDEYFYDDDIILFDYNYTIEPWEPNLTTLVNFKEKWKSFVKKSTPVPTPRTEKYEKEVGAFEGGGYVKKKMYSPVQDCRMKTNTTPNFCPVCSNEIEKAILFHIE